LNRVGPWAEFPITYRQEQVRAILGWLAVGESGGVVGVSGAGKSNLLGFLASRSDVVQSLLGDAAASICFLLLDINGLPTLTETALYRAMLQMLYERKHCLPLPLQEELAEAYSQQIASQDDLRFNAAQAIHRAFCYGGGKKIVAHVQI
jgi:ABC-type phosphate transport system ATPase subunit